MADSAPGSTPTFIDTMWTPNDRKPWSLRIPYNFRGEWRGLYPDFLFVRSEPDGLVVDILDPHAISLSPGDRSGASCKVPSGRNWSAPCRLRSGKATVRAVMPLVLVDDVASRRRIKGSKSGQFKWASDQQGTSKVAEFLTS
jgi:hypothetical protein